MEQRIDLNIAEGDTFASMDPQSYKENWPQYILKLENSYIGGGGAIYNANGSLNKDANFNYNFWGNLHNEEARPNNILESQDIKKNINLPDYTVKELPDKGNYIYAHHYFNIYVFGHYWDTLQDLSKIETLNLSHKVLITPKVTDHVKDLDLHLELFGYPKENRISLDLPANRPCNILYKVPLLYYPSPTAYPCQVSKEGLEYLRSKYYPPWDTYAPSTKLYLRRPKGNTRIVINEEEVVSFLKNKDFTILDGTEGIKEHVRLFRNARVIIGMHGSLFKNLIFSDKNPLVYEFCPHNREDHNFEGMGKTMGLDYKWIKTEAGDNHNIKINLDECFGNEFGR